jgi:hypothetical protein
MVQSNDGKINSNPNDVSLKDLIYKIKEWWQYLLSKWLVICVAGVIGGTIGFVRAHLKHQAYIAELSFTVQGDKSGGGLSGALGLASQFGIDLGGASAGGEFSGDNLLELMKSRSIIEKALLTSVTIKGKNQTLADYYISINHLRNDWNKKPELKYISFPNADRSKFTLAQDSILGVFHKDIVHDNVSIDKLDKKLSIITLKVISGDELFSKYFTEVLAKVVSDYYVQSKTEKSAKNVAILQKQTDSVRAALNLAISGAASYADNTPNPNPARLVLRVPVQRRQIDVQANTAILNELVKNLEVSKMSLLQETPLIQVIDRPILPLEKTKRGRLVAGAIGGLLFSFLVALFWVIKKLINDILNN